VEGMEDGRLPSPLSAPTAKRCRIDGFGVAPSIWVRKGEESDALLEAIVRIAD